MAEDPVQDILPRISVVENFGAPKTGCRLQRCAVQGGIDYIVYDFASQLVTRDVRTLKLGKYLRQRRVFWLYPLWLQAFCVETHLG